jgi:hypothetical protein
MEPRYESRIPQVEVNWSGRRTKRHTQRSRRVRPSRRIWRFYKRIVEEFSWWCFGGSSSAYSVAGFPVAMGVRLTKGARARRTL